jgi:hypothetical protein
MERSAERAARNEALFRDANEQIDHRRRDLGVAEPTPYICECSREGCMELVRISADEYVAVRTKPMHFLQVPGHADDHERVVAERDGYVVVEKTASAGAHGE